MRAFLSVIEKVAFVIFALIVATPLPASADDCGSPTQTSNNCPQHSPGVFFPLINVGSNKCFQPTAQGAAVDVPGLLIQQHTCNPFNLSAPPTIQGKQFQPLGYVIYNGQHHWWCPGCIELGAEGFFIQNFISFSGNTVVSLCLDVRDGATSDAAVVQQWTCRDSSARSMVWYTSQGDFPGAVKVRNVNSDRCLDVRGGSSAEGAQLQQYHCTSNNPAQNFWQTVSQGTQIDLNGNWTDGSTRNAHIYEGPSCPTSPCVSIMIDMSAFGRPNASGSVVDPSTISVTFPDDKAYTGQIQSPNTIRWSNGSIWTKN
jgi:hypothetical protein